MKSLRSTLITFLIVLSAIMSSMITNSASAGTCPKVLFFDGFEPNHEINEQEARYWESAGAQGFFVNRVFTDWLTSVGDDESSPIYQRMRQFQTIYASHGISYNFLKVATYKSVDWGNDGELRQIVKNFGQAAHLAHYAGFKGLAVDLEPYPKGYWATDPVLPDKAQRVRRLGRSIAQTIISQFPGAELFTLPEVTYYERVPDTHLKYALAPAFLEELSHAPFSKYVVGTELTYNLDQPQLITNAVTRSTMESVNQSSVRPLETSVAVGLWPLGITYTNKGERDTPEKFKARLIQAVRLSPDYVWIYGHGSAWEKNGPYGQGDTDPKFDQYVRTVREVKEACSH
jgi:hypothetical protein